MNQFSAQKLRALIVEDDRSLALLAKQSLLDYKDINFDVVSANSKSSAWEVFRRHRPHLTLLDITLPDGNGLDLINRMVEENPHTYIVIVTGSAYTHDVERAKQLGAMGYILKPFNLGKFNEMVGGCLEYYSKLSILEDYFTERPAARNTEKLAFIDRQEEKKESISIEKIIQEWKVLYVDHFHVNLENVRMHLQRIGCGLETASSSKEAWQKLNEKEYQVVFMNVQSPDGSGYEVTEKIRQLEQQKKITTPAIIVGLMENLQEKEKRTWLYSGMNDYLIKPCRFGDLEEKLRKFATLRLRYGTPREVAK